MWVFPHQQLSQRAQQTHSFSSAPVGTCLSEYPECQAKDVKWGLTLICVVAENMVVGVLELQVQLPGERVVVTIQTSGWNVGRGASLS